MNTYHVKCFLNGKIGNECCTKSVRSTTDKGYYENEYYALANSIERPKYPNN